MIVHRRLLDRKGPDFFPTPPWATWALVMNEKFKGNVWECACGDGAISRVLKQTISVVYSSDLHAHGFGESGHDFLKTNRRADNIVTNPPFNLAEEFVAVGLSRAKYKVALLLRLAFLEGAHRARTLFKHSPPARLWVFSERVTFYRSGAEKKGGGTAAYAWFVWDKSAPSGTEVRWIAPGYRREYSQP